MGLESDTEDVNAVHKY